MFSSSSVDNLSKAAIKAILKAEGMALKTDLKAIERAYKDQSEHQDPLLKDHIKADIVRQTLDRVAESINNVTASDVVKSSAAADPKISCKLEEAKVWIEAAKVKLATKEVLKAGSEK